MKKLLLLLTLFTYSVSAFEKKQEIDILFEAWDKPNVPGAAIGVIKDGKLLYSNAYGSGDLEHDIALTPSSLFNIGSISKQFVAFSILLLEEQGKIDLDNEIQKYLPDFPEYDKPLTIRHLIHHNSGIRDYLTLMVLQGRNILDGVAVDEVYDLIKKQEKLNFSPGGKYLYSNSGYFMLALIIEKVTGQSLKVFAEENIFQPLGMKSTLFYDDRTDLIKNRVFSYEKNKNEKRFDNLISRYDMIGAGGVYTNIEDLFLWDQNFYNNKLGKGGKGIIEKMHEEGLFRNGYAFGLINGTYKGLKTVSHSGSFAGYRSELLRFPGENFSVIVLANRGDADPTSLSYKIADIVLKEKLLEQSQKKRLVKDTKNKITKTKPKALETFNINQLTGNYERQEGVALEIIIRNGSLHVIQSWNKSNYFIENTAKNTYTIPGNTSTQFVFSNLQNDVAQILTVLHDGNPEPTYNRKEKIHLSEVNLKDYIGSFYSHELDTTVEFFVEDETLKVKVANYGTYELHLHEVDIFIHEVGWARFIRSEGIISGFELNAGRVTNLKFVKR